MNAPPAEPRFVVVGHPNKGKSSIVATLAQDPGVEIANISGTTRHGTAYPMRVDDRVLYTLVDTPGFQRARKALAWMSEHATSAEQHPEAVRKFVVEHEKAGTFPDECELLKPIVNDDAGGAGILYVVDGSVPYSPEYEAEMQILRWSGRPRMALINPIRPEADHVAEWEAALGQYFSVVRVFNAVTAEFDKQLELLRAFGQLHEPWREPMAEAVRLLADRRDGQRHASARAIAQMLGAALTHVESGRIGYDDDPTATRAKLEQRYRNRLRQAEQDCRQAVEAAYDHPAVARDEPELDVLGEDLFSESSQRVFGLTRRQAAQLGVLGGAGLGAALDVAAGGLTFGVFTAAGGVAAGAAAWLGFDKIARVRVLKLKRLGAKEVTVGPLINVNLRHTLLARAVVHHRLIASRTHAQRDPVQVNLDETGSLNPLPTSATRGLEPHFKALRQAGDDEMDAAKAVDALTEAIEVLLS